MVKKYCKIVVPKVIWVFIRTIYHKSRIIGWKSIYFLIKHTRLCFLFKEYSAYSLFTNNDDNELSEKIDSPTCYQTTLEAIKPVFAYNKVSHEKMYQREYTKKNYIFFNAYLYGASSVIYFNDSKCYLESSTYNNVEICDTCTYIRYIDHKGVVLKKQKTKKIFDKAYFLTGNFSFNLYHFLFEYCVKFIDIIDEKIPIIIDEICFETKQFREILSYLLPSNEVYVIKKDEKIQINELYYITAYNIIPPNFKKIDKVSFEDVQFNRGSLSYLKNKLMSHSSTRIFPSRFYLSRKNASSRRKFNEAEVYQVLNKYGFVEIFPEELSYAEQISLFMNAEYIAGGSGAAFSNLFLCSPLCTALIFYKYELDFSGFTNLCLSNNAKIIYITDYKTKLHDIKDIHEDFSIDCIRLSELLKTTIK